MDISWNLGAKTSKPLSQNDQILILGRYLHELFLWFSLDRFYLPHGLVIDQSGNYWLTDVGMHQVFKYSPKGDILLTLGEKLVPGGDRDHFCKPTDVAVLKDGTFFVSDGYCNRRVIKYSPGGQRIMEIGRAGSDTGGEDSPFSSCEICLSLSILFSPVLFFCLSGYGLCCVSIGSTAF